MLPPTLRTRARVGYREHGLLTTSPMYLLAHFLHFCVIEPLPFESYPTVTQDEDILMGISTPGFSSKVSCAWSYIQLGLTGAFCHSFRGLSDCIFARYQCWKKCQVSPGCSPWPGTVGTTLASSQPPETRLSSHAQKGRALCSLLKRMCNLHSALCFPNYSTTRTWATLHWSVPFTKALEQFWQGQSFGIWLTSDGIQSLYSIK